MPRLYDHDWNGAKAKFVSTRITYIKLAEEFGIREGLLRKRAQREKWPLERREFSQRVVDDAKASVAREIVVGLKEWNADTLVEAERLRESARRLFMRKRTDGRWLFLDTVSANNLAAAATTNLAADKLARLALGASTENNTNRSLPASVDDFV